MNFITRMVKKIEIDESELLFSFISNYNLFQIAKQRGEFDGSPEVYAKLLKYELSHSNRALMKTRLFSLLITALKEEARAELGIAGEQ